MLRQPTTDHVQLSYNIMAKKKPYIINMSADGTISLTIAGLTERFKNKETFVSFALQFCRQVSNRRTGIFHLQDSPEGKLQMVMHKTGNVITFKNYDQAAKLAEMLTEDLMTLKI